MSNDNPDVPNRQNEVDSVGNSCNQVAEHYNKKDKIDLQTRSESRIFYLRNFNNWVKSVLINEYIKLLNPNDREARPLKILDLGCGRGGDMRKWIKARNVAWVTFADLAEKSLEECKSRYYEARPRFTPKFIHLDATRDLLTEKLGYYLLYTFESIWKHSYINEPKQNKTKKKMNR